MWEATREAEALAILRLSSSTAHMLLLDGEVRIPITWGGKGVIQLVPYSTWLSSTLENPTSAPFSPASFASSSLLLPSYEKSSILY